MSFIVPGTKSSNTVYLNGKPIAAQTLKPLNGRRQTVHRLEIEPFSSHSALPSNVRSVIVKQQKEGWEAEFRREKEAYNIFESLQGKVIPKLFGEGSLNGTPALILSEIAGFTLEELARNKVEVREDSLRRQLKEALSALYQYGAEYSDLRPDNFLVCDNDKAMIVDLEGVTFPGEPEEPSDSEDCDNLGDVGYLMSKFRDIKDPNRPSSPIPSIPESTNDKRRGQNVGFYAVGELVE